MTKRKTPEEFLTEVDELVGDEYTLLSDYTLTKNKVAIKHNVCGHTWSIKAGNFLRGDRCPKCSKFKNTTTFKKEVKELTNDNLEVLSGYIDYITPINFRCKIHNHVFSTAPSHVLRGRKVCIKCNIESVANSQRKTNKQFYRELHDRHEGRIVCEDSYINTHTKIKFRCLKCKTLFKSEPNSVLRISGCPNCAQSKGEATIGKYLAKHSKDYISQKTYEDCKHLRLLPFDFYVPSLNLLIEYDGKQHFTPIEFFGGEEAFKYQVVRDTIKNNYARDNGINLVRIPYTLTDEEIFLELDKHLKVGSLN